MVAIRREFRVVVPDSEWELLATFADAHADLIRRLAINSQDPAQTQLIWNRLCTAVLANPECRVSESPNPSTPFIRTIFSKVYA